MPRVIDDSIVEHNGSFYVHENDYNDIWDMNVETVKELQKTRSELETLRKELTRLKRIERRRTQQWYDENWHTIVMSYQSNQQFVRSDINIK